jgi:hypothetical protein
MTEIEKEIGTIADARVRNVSHCNGLCDERWRFVSPTPAFTPLLIAPGRAGKDGDGGRPFDHPTTPAGGRGRIRERAKVRGTSYDRDKKIHSARSARKFFSLADLWANCRSLPYRICPVAKKSCSSDAGKPVQRQSRLAGTGDMSVARVCTRL